MSELQETKDAVMALLLDHPVAYHPALAHCCGGAMAAVFLSQLLYWTGRSNSEDGWIYKTIEEWEDETGLTYSEQRTARKRLEMFGVIEEELRGVPARLYYRVNFEAVILRLSGAAPAISDEKPRDENGQFQKQDSHDMESQFSTSWKTSVPQSAKHNMEPETTSETTNTPANAGSATFEDLFGSSETKPIPRIQVPVDVNPTDYYRQQLEAAHDRTVQRAVEKQQQEDMWETSQAAQAWFSQHPNAERGLILRLLRGLHKDMGMCPDWQTPSDVKSWLSGADKLLRISGRDLSLIRDVALQMRSDDLSIPEPHSMVKMVQDAAAKKRAVPQTSSSPYVYTGA